MPDKLLLFLLLLPFVGSIVTAFLWRTAARTLPASLAGGVALGATVLTAEANPQALEAKVKQQVPQWAELFKKAGVEAQ